MKYKKSFLSSIVAVRLENVTKTHLEKWIYNASILKKHCFEYQLLVYQHISVKDTNFLSLLI